MTLKTLAKFLKEGTEVKIYDGETLVEITGAGKVLESDDNFYVLSVVRQLECQRDGSAIVNLRGEEVEA